MRKLLLATRAQVEEVNADHAFLARRFGYAAQPEGQAAHLELHFDAAGVVARIGIGHLEAAAVHAQIYNGAVQVGTILEEVQIG